MSTAEVAWTDTAASVTTVVTIPKFGGIMHLSEGTIFPWSGSDPDSETQCFSYKESDKTWNYVGTYDAKKPRRKGAEHIGMYHAWFQVLHQDQGKLYYIYWHDALQWNHTQG